MKKQNTNIGIGKSIFITITFAVLAILTYQLDDVHPVFVVFPCLMVVVGMCSAIVEYNGKRNEIAKREHQENVGMSICHDSSVGDDNLKLYFDSSRSVVTVCASSHNGTEQKIIYDFLRGEVVRTDKHLVALDSTNSKLLCAANDNGHLALQEYNLKTRFKALGITTSDLKPVLKAYNDYAFVIDDANECIIIVTPSDIHVHRFADIVSISCEENGSSYYTKSVDKSVTGGILSGGATAGRNDETTSGKKLVTDISIKISLKSISDPTIILNIYKGAIGKFKKGDDRGIVSEEYIREASGIADIFTVIIDLMAKKAEQPAKVTPTSVADELIKLAQLKDSGILSEEEFQSQKAKLLNQ